MISYSFYHKDTGAIHPTIFSSDDDSQLANNTPVDNVAIDGQFDSLSQRVDIATGQVIDYQPPQPSTDFEWNAGTKRWQLTATAAAKIDGNARARARIAVLENAQHRAVREAMLDPLGGIARLKAINDEIASLRPQLQ